MKKTIPIFSLKINGNIYSFIIVKAAASSSYQKILEIFRKSRMNIAFIAMWLILWRKPGKWEKPGKMLKKM